MYNHGYMATLTDDPMTHAEVQNRPDWPSWKAAMDVELKALQELGKDFDEVFAPVSKHATFRMLLSIVASDDLELHHIDIKAAFMNGEIREELYSHLAFIRPSIIRSSRTSGPKVVRSDHGLTISAV
jgi:hypothetical protein